jgi:cytidylate kinase
MSATNDARARVIAIDGPAASGKSVVGSAVARALGYRFFDTGAMYRAVTWLALRRGVDPSGERALVTLIEGCEISVHEAKDEGSERTRVIVDGDDATPYLRDDDVEMNVSLVSKVPRVRATLVAIQRRLAAPGRVVMAGRDIGTVVLPDADLKVFLEASARVRAARRVAQLRAAGVLADIDELSAELERRDRIDSTRDASPLTPASDAVIINTDDMTIDQVVAKIVELAA